MVNMSYSQTKLNHKYFIYMYKEDLALNKLTMVDISQNITELNHIYIRYMYKEVLALNKLRWLICHKTQPNQSTKGYISHSIFKLSDKKEQNELEDHFISKPGLISIYLKAERFFFLFVERVDV